MADAPPRADTSPTCGRELRKTSSLSEACNDDFADDPEIGVLQSHAENLSKARFAKKIAVNDGKDLVSSEINRPCQSMVEASCPDSKELLE